MRRRSGAGGEPVKTRRRKAATLKRRNGSKTVLRRSSPAGQEIAQLTHELSDTREPSLRPSLPVKGLGWACPSVTTSLSSNMAGLLSSIRSPVSSPNFGLSCRARERPLSSLENACEPARSRG